MNLLVFVVVLVLAGFRLVTSIPNNYKRSGYILKDYSYSPMCYVVPCETLQNYFNDFVRFLYHGQEDEKQSAPAYPIIDLRMD